MMVSEYGDLILVVLSFQGKSKIEKTDDVIPAQAGMTSDR